METEEIWKDIIGFEGYYQISSLGRVKGVRRCIYNKGRVPKKIIKEKILKLIKNKTGYLTVELNKNKFAKIFTIHRLIAQAFIPNPENKPVVNHIDFNRINNSIDNLEWCTIKENVNHSICNITKGEKSHLSKFTEEKVKEVLKRKGSMSAQKLSKELGMSPTNIYDIWNRRIWKHINV